MDRIYMNRKKLDAMRIELMSRNFYMIIGNSSFSVPELGEKYINIEVCKPYPDLDGEVIMMTSGEAAITELKRQYPKYKSPFYKSYKELMKKGPPLYYTGQIETKGSYIDLIGAYSQIGKRMCLDDAYPRGIGTLSLEPVLKKLDHWKPARNAVFGLMRKNSVRAYKNGKEWSQSLRGKYANIAVWANLMDMLNMVALTAKDEYHAFYINTDGYMLPHPYNLHFKQYLDSLEMNYREITGYLSVNGWGGYKAEGPQGLKETKPYKNYTERVQERAKSNIDTISNYFQGQGNYRAVERRIISWWTKRGELNLSGLPRIVGR